MFNYILERAKEPSTFAGLAGVAGAVGVASPTYSAITNLIMAIAGVIAVFKADK